MAKATKEKRADDGFTANVSPEEDLRQRVQAAKKRIEEGSITREDALKFYRLKPDHLPSR